MPIVSLEEINETLKLDLETDGNSPPEFIDDRVDAVEACLEQADDIVREFLKVDADDWPPEDVPLRHKRAVIIAFEALFDDHQDWITGLQADPPSGPIAAILRLDRTPTLA